MTSLVERDRAALFEKIGPEERDPTLASATSPAIEVSWCRSSIPVLVGDKVANRAFVIGAGGRFRPPTTRSTFSAWISRAAKMARVRHLHGGDRAVLAETPWGLIGVTICYDVRFPALYRTLAENGASFLSHRPVSRADRRGALARSPEGAPSKPARSCFPPRRADSTRTVEKPSATRSSSIRGARTRRGGDGARRDLAEIDTRLVADARSHSDAEACPPVPHRNDQRQTAVDAA